MIGWKEFEKNLIYKNVTQQYYVQNLHGDVDMLVDDDGNDVKTYTYDAFGVEENKSETDTNPFRYCGEYYDSETDSIYLRARYYSPTNGRFTTEDPVKDGTNWYAYCGGNPISCIDPTGLTMDGDQAYSDGANIYINFYSQGWEKANKEYTRCIELGNLDAAKFYKQKMDQCHVDADYIRELDKEGKVQGTILDVPIYNQYDTSAGGGTNLCWATVVSMWISYILGDDINRVDEISTIIADLSLDGTKINVPRAWITTEYVAKELGLDITQSQRATDSNFVIEQIIYNIEKGDPMGIEYHSQKGVGHIVLGVGYAMVEGVDIAPLVVTNDPEGGIQRIQTYDDAQTYGDMTCTRTVYRTK